MKTLTIIVSNTFLGTKLVEYRFPIDPRKVAYNIERVDKNFIRAKVFLRNIHTERMNIHFPSGVVFDCPFELSKIDIEIINLHLKALRLAKGWGVLDLTVASPVKDNHK